MCTKVWAQEMFRNCYICETIKMRVMVKVYVMESCPDCVEVKARYKEDPGYELVDIGQQARSLKEFLVLRDNHPAFAY